MRYPNTSRRTVLIFSASALVLSLVWQHIHATRLGYDVERTRRQAQGLRARIGGLRMELETEVSPARLAAQARSRLGMYPAPPDALRALGVASDARASETFLGRLISRSWRTVRPAT